MENNKLSTLEICVYRGMHAYVVLSRWISDKAEMEKLSGLTHSVIFQMLNDLHSFTMLTRQLLVYGFENWREAVSKIDGPMVEKKFQDKIYTSLLQTRVSSFMEDVYDIDDIEDDELPHFDNFLDLPTDALEHRLHSLLLALDEDIKPFFSQMWSKLETIERWIKDDAKILWDSIEEMKTVKDAIVDGTFQQPEINSRLFVSEEGFLMLEDLETGKVTNIDPEWDGYPPDEDEEDWKSE